MKKNNLLLPTLFMIAALATLIALGTWQMQRHAWKENLLSKMNQSIDAGATSFESLKQNKESLDQFQFQYAKLEGHFLHDKEIHVYAVRFGRPGALIFTPMILETGEVLMINRGFISQQALDAGKVKETHINTKAQIQGLIRLSDAGGFLTPEPNKKKRLWYAFNIPQMKAFLKLKNLQESYYVQADEGSTKSQYIKGSDPKKFVSAIPNKHWEYAWTWYGIALTLIGVYVALIWGRVRGK